MRTRLFHAIIVAGTTLGAVAVLAGCGTTGGLDAAAPDVSGSNDGAAGADADVPVLAEMDAAADLDAEMDAAAVHDAHTTEAGWPTTK